VCSSRSGLLTGYGAGDCITHEEDLDRGVLASAKGAGEANGVEGLVGTVGGAVDYEQDLLIARSSSTLAALENCRDLDEC
jgi:hypothetical protein